ncbi:MAG TPA: methyl-accepting chemotaxis protein, partial [Symbiobacteriaceae bacterium]|nr:methyl-accepting chemotaxis protein [Symbiobacteriaceae bacterium]
MQKRRLHSLAFKLALGFGTVLALLVLTVAIALVQLIRLNDAYADALIQRSRGLAVAGTIAEVSARKDATVRRFLTGGADSDRLAIRTADNQLATALEEMEPFVPREGDARVLFENLKANVAELKTLYDGVVSNVQDGNLPGATILLASSTTAIASQESLVDEFRQVQMDAADAAIVTLSDQAQQTMLALVGASALALLAGIFFAVRTARQVLLPVRLVTAAAQRLAEGDLTVTEVAVSTKDELGDMAQNVGRALANLREAFASVAASAAFVAEASDQLADTSEQATRASQEISGAVAQIATRAQEQTSSAVTAADAIESLRGAVAQIARGAEEQAAGVQSSAQDVSRVMGEVDVVSAGVDMVSGAAARAAAA